MLTSFFKNYLQYLFSCPVRYTHASHIHASQIRCNLFQIHYIRTWFTYIWDGYFPALAHFYLISLASLPLAHLYPCISIFRVPNIHVWLSRSPLSLGIYIFECMWYQKYIYQGEIWKKKMIYLTWNLIQNLINIEIICNYIKK